MMRRDMIRIAVGLALVMAMMRTGFCDEGQQPAVAPAQESWTKDLSLNLSGAYQGMYVWRGFRIVDGSVFQPSATLGYNGFSASVWGNMDLTDANHESGNFTEVDLTLSYSKTCDIFNFGAGAINYQFPNSHFITTTEVYGSVGLTTLLAPTITLYQDVDACHGRYGVFSISHTVSDFWKPAEKVAVSADALASVAVGSSQFNQFNTGLAKTCFNDADLSVGLPVKLGDRAVLRPSVNYTSLLDHALRDAVKDPDNVWFGLSLSFSF